MITARDGAILLAISGAVAAGGDWPVMLRAICEHMPADAARLYMPSGGWSEGGPLAGALPDALAGLRLSRVYTGEELAERLAQAPELPQAEDWRVIGMRLPDGAAWLLIARRRGAFRAADSATLTALVPHLAQAIALAARVSTLLETGAEAEALLRRLGIARVQWDRNGRLAPRDALAQEVLAREVLARHPAVPGPPGAGVTLTRLAPDIELLAQADANGALRGVMRVGGQTLPAPDLIAQALGVTRAEARLARALGQGDSLREAAARLGLTIETARSYSKQIYAKTGLRGQADLMRRLWTGAAVLAEPGARQDRTE